MNYDTWESAVTNIIAEKLRIAYSDAAALVEAQPFYMNQSWGLDLTVEETADIIISASE